MMGVPTNAIGFRYERVMDIVSDLMDEWNEPYWNVTKVQVLLQDLNFGVMMLQNRIDDWLGPEDGPCPCGDQDCKG